MTDDKPIPNTFDKEMEDDRERSDALGKAIDKAEAEHKSAKSKPDHEPEGGVI